MSVIPHCLLSFVFRKKEMAVTEDREFWREFFLLYKRLPELWDSKYGGYKDSSTKNVAYGKLADLMKRIDPNANIETVKKKINTLRGCYRRELEKKEKRKKLEGGTSKKYGSTLWYFEELGFLYEKKTRAVSNKSSNVEKTQNLEQYKKESDESDQLLQDIIIKCDHQDGIQDYTIENMNDCAEIYGRAWAAQFRHLSPEQQIHAKRAMDEILYQGSLGRLPKRRSHSPAVKEKYL